MNRRIINRIINESIDEVLDSIIDDEINNHDERMMSDRDYAFRNARFPDITDELPRDEYGDILDNDDLYDEYGDNTRRNSGIDPRLDAMFTDWGDSPYNMDI